MILAMLITVIRTQKNLTEVLEDIPKLSEFKVLLENTTLIWRLTVSKKYC